MFNLGLYINKVSYQIFWAMVQIENNAAIAYNEVKISLEYSMEALKKHSLCDIDTRD